ncbi:MAG: hypothetical protein QW465_01315 [Candidatus Anstonellales archaeon]
MLAYLYRYNDIKQYFYLSNRGDLVIDRSLQLEPGVYDIVLNNGYIQAQKLDMTIDEFIEQVDFGSWQPLFEIPDGLRNHMLKFAKKLLKYKLENRFVLIRSHNDADGFGAAVGLNRIFPWSMKIIYPTPTYQLKDAISDISLLMNKNNPVMILSDLGGNSESQQALNLFKVHGIDYVVIDHHPFQNPDPEHYLISWEYDNSGKYTATYLTNEIARILGYEHDEFIYIGLVGDKSPLIQHTEELRLKSMIVDFLTSYTNDFNFIYQVMTNPNLYQEYMNSAKEKYGEIGDLIRESYYMIIKGVKVYFIDAEKIIRRIEFQSTGKIASYILDIVGDNSVILVYNNNRYTIRIGEGAFAKGIDTHKIMNSVKEFILGGGHLRAASFKFHGANRKMIESKIIETIRQVLNNENSG